MLHRFLPFSNATALALPGWRRRPWACVRLLAVWLVLAQVLLPVLGHMHAQAHGSVRAAAADVLGVEQNSSPLHDFFGAHSKLDCQTFDHQAFGQPISGAVPVLPLAAYAPVMVATLHALLLRQSPALYFARGPPV